MTRTTRQTPTKSHALKANRLEELRRWNFAREHGSVDAEELPNMSVANAVGKKDQKIIFRPRHERGLNAHLAALKRTEIGEA